MGCSIFRRTCCADCSLCGLHIIDVIALSFPSPHCILPPAKDDILIRFIGEKSRGISSLVARGSSLVVKSGKAGL